MLAKGANRRHILTKLTGNVASELSMRKLWVFV